MRDTRNMPKSMRDAGAIGLALMLTVGSGACSGDVGDKNGAPAKNPAANKNVLSDNDACVGDVVGEWARVTTPTRRDREIIGLTCEAVEAEANASDCDGYGPWQHSSSVFGPENMRTLRSLPRASKSTWLSKSGVCPYSRQFATGMTDLAAATFLRLYSLPLPADRRAVSQVSECLQEGLNGKGITAAQRCNVEVWAEELQRVRGYGHDAIVDL